MSKANGLIAQIDEDDRLVQEVQRDERVHCHACGLDKSAAEFYPSVLKETRPRCKQCHREGRHVGPRYPARRKPEPAKPLALSDDLVRNDELMTALSLALTELTRAERRALVRMLSAFDGTEPAVTHG